MVPTSCSLVQFLSCVSISILISSAMAAASNRPLAPALYVFGDSLLDNGNNNFLPTEARVNYRPYGIDFPNGPTGRFTNGRTVADFIAEYLGLPYPPPIIGLPKPGWVTGFNYASGACGILNQTGANRGKCLNLEKQIDLFSKTIQKMIKNGHMKTQLDASFHLSKSIFVYSSGTNDYINTYLDPKRIMTLLYSPKQFSQLLIDNLSLKLQKLYKLGARKVVFFELGPVGCMPNQAKTTKHDGLCNESLNWMVSLFNNGLRDLLSNLSSTLPESHFILAKVYGLTYDAITHPSKYGLSNGKDPCCRAWANNTITCIPELRPRRDHSKNFFWDGYHPTEVACKLIASQCFNGSSLCLPLNIQQLIQL